MSRNVLIIIGAAALVAAAAFSISSLARGEAGAKYAGSKQCLSCHQGEHETWQEMKHAKAWDSLRPEDVDGRKDDRGRACVRCHVTGYGLTNGFVSAKETPLLTGVGCEACHGPGRTHIDTMIKGKLDEVEVEDKRISKSVGCETCHNPHVSHRKTYGGR